MTEQRDVQIGVPGDLPEGPGGAQLPAAAPAPGAAPAQGAAHSPATAHSPGAAHSSAADKLPVSEETASLMGLIDRLTALLERSDLDELEVEAGQTGIVLRKPSALHVAAVAGPGTQAAADGAGVSDSAARPAEVAPASTTRSVRAPLTGIFYGASSPGAPAYVTVGQEIAVGHVIGLIEAMKLFNEIKSDTAGRVVRVVAETGKLVKAKQPLIEVEP
jgi:acetyl-CoA carboxylase biotin carboxyl carrier protein